MAGCVERRNSLALAHLDTAVDSAVAGEGVFKVTWDANEGAASVLSAAAVVTILSLLVSSSRDLLKGSSGHYEVHVVLLRQVPGTGASARS